MVPRVTPRSDSPPGFILPIKATKSSSPTHKKQTLVQDLHTNQLVLRQGSLLPSAMLPWGPT